MSGKKADMTKSVLSQSTQMKSGSAVALGALMSKKGAGSRRAESSERGSSKDGGESSAPADATKSSKKPDMTKSVLSMAPNMKSGSAAALESLMATKGAGSKRGKSAERGEDMQSVVAPSAPPAAPALPSQASTPKTRDEKSIDDTGEVLQNDAIQQDDEEAWRTAERPTHAENEGQSLHTNLVGFSNKQDLAQLTQKTLLHRDDGRHASRGYGSTCCSQSDAYQIDVVSRPRDKAGCRLEGFREPETFLQRHVQHPCYLASVHIETCSADLLQEIAEA